MESVFEAFISNPALYSAGHLVGETLHFPTNTEEVQSLLKRIGVDGVRCQEYFIISFDSDILGLYDYLGEYENIDELNHLAHLLKELSPSERETLEAVMDSDQHCGSVQDLINLTQNLDCYDLHPGVDNEEMLGRLYVEDMESLEVPDNIKPYFDFEASSRSPLHSRMQISRRSRMKPPLPRQKRISRWRSPMQRRKPRRLPLPQMHRQRQTANWRKACPIR